MNFDFKIGADLLKALTWKKIAQVIVLFLVIGFFWFAWMFRTNMYSSLKMGSLSEVDQTIVIDLTKETKTRLNDTVNRLPNLVAGIQIINVNFKKNSRSTSYSYVTEPILKASMYEYEETLVTATPLFNSNEVNNKRIVDLVNGEFICTPFKNTLGAKIYPKAVATVTTICSVSIPPHYGKFSGYMNLYLKHPPDITEIDMIRQLLFDLAGKIYVTDILRETDPAEKAKPVLRREDIR